MEAGWFYSGRQIRHYFPSRFTSLKPPKTKLKNPYAVLRQLDAHQVSQNQREIGASADITQWNMFLVGFAAWAWDGDRTFHKQT